MSEASDKMRFFGFFFGLLCLFFSLSSCPAYGQVPPKVKVATKVIEPFIMREKGKIQGFCIDLLDQIFREMGLEYELL